jgi:hypothetical protein
MIYSVIHPFYNHNETLKLHLPYWLRYFKGETEIILVDDCSPNGLDTTHLDKLSCRVTVARVQKDIPWNVTGARNLGASLAIGKYLIMSDFDCCVHPGLIKTLRTRVQTMKYREVLWPLLLMQEPTRRTKDGKLRQPHCNSFVMEKQFFNDIGGYDEDFAGGWGYEDSYFHQYQAAYHGATNTVMDAPGYFRYFRGHNHGEYARGRLNEQVNVTKFKDKISREDYKKPNGPTLRFNWDIVYKVNH